jgi:phosphoglycerate dehydrogenase-like enzyme
MTQRIILWSPVARWEITARLAAFSDLELMVVEDLAALADAMPEAQALVMMGQFYDAETARVLRRDGGQLRWIQLLTAGYDGLSFHGVPPGIIVSNAGDSYSPVVAEHAMALLLALVRRLPEIAANQARHTFDRSVQARLGSLAGSTLAIIGYGSIGREVARRARAFGMRIVGVSRSARPEALADEMQPLGALRDVLARADAVLLAVPLSPATRHLIGAAELASCKSTAILINVARGGVLDPAALGDALRQGRIAGAGLDVTEPEPLPPDDPLWDCPNLIISPHVAGFGGGAALDSLAELVAGNLARLRAGEPLAHTVSLP